MAETLRTSRRMGVAEMALYMLTIKRRNLPPWAPPAPERIPETVAAEPVAAAVVNHDRWIVNCPFCPSAELADPADRRFWCIDCYNAGAGGLWVTVMWPEDPEAIEAELNKRPDKTTRNWVPGETLEVLAAQTLALADDQMMAALALGPL